MNCSFIAAAPGEYALRPAQEGFELRGGRLEEPLVFRAPDIDIPIRMVGFLTCYTGGLLRRYDGDGLLVAECRFPGGRVQTDSNGPPPFKNRRLQD